MTRPKKLIPFLLAILMALLYFGFPIFSHWLTGKPQYAKYAERDAPRIVEGIQIGLVYPIGEWLPAFWRGLIVFLIGSSYF